MRFASFCGVMMLVCLPSLGGCDSMRPNRARLFALESAAYAGRFRPACDGWPAPGAAAHLREVEW